MSESLIAALRHDAEKWRERAAADGGALDRKAEETLALLDEYDRVNQERLRAIADAQELLRVLALAPQPHPDTWEWRWRYVNEWLPLLRDTLAERGVTL